MGIIKFFEKHKNLSWIFVLFVALVIFYVSSLTSKQAPQIFSFQSIVYHFIIFFILAFFLLFAVIQGKKFNFLIIPIAIALVYAVLDEFHQLFVPGRACSFSDFMINSFGILFAGLIYSFSLKSRKK